MKHLTQKENDAALRYADGSDLEKMNIQLAAFTAGLRFHREEVERLSYQLYGVWIELGVVTNHEIREIGEKYFAQDQRAGEILHELVLWADARNCMGEAHTAIVEKARQFLRDTS